MATDYGALHNLKEMNQESISFEDMGLSQILDMDMPAEAAMSDDEFLNSFMDLSEFLLPVSLFVITTRRRLKNNLAKLLNIFYAHYYQICDVYSLIVRIKMSFQVL